MARQPRVRRSRWAQALHRSGAAILCRSRQRVAHVGDSRAYRLRGDVDFVQLTDDHSLVAQQVREGLMTESEAAVSPLQSVFGCAPSGVEANVEVEVDEELVVEGDIYMLCSDGLTRELSDTQIAAVLRSATTSQQAADQLVELANLAGGADNVTVIVIRAMAKPVGPLREDRQLDKGFRQLESRTTRNLV